MLILVTYDVNTTSSAGKKRLRDIAKECVKYGQRVQNSVFECSVDATQYKFLKSSLCEKMDEKKDSIRFYNLGNNYKYKVECFGVKTGYDARGILIV